MKKFLILSCIALSLAIGAGFASADSVGTVSPWIVSGTSTITTRNASSTVKVPSLSGSGTRCLHISSAGLIGVASGDCGVAGSGISSLNSQTGNSQTFATSSTGTGFSLTSSGDVHTLRIGTASGSNSGLLSSTDWNTFNSKQAAGSYITLGSLSASSPLVYNSGTGAFTINLASSTANGYLSSTDWSTFNGKEGAISAGTTAQYWRGDKSFQTLNQAAVAGLTTGSSPTFTGLTLSGLSDGCLTAATGVITSGSCSSGGITLLNGASTSTQTFATSTADANIKLTITTATSTGVHTFTPSFSGTLSAARGGTALDTSASTGFISLSGGVWAVNSTSTQKTLLALNNVENTALSTWAGSANITTLGTIGTGTWNGTVLTGQYGGTGVANTGKTITLGGNLTTSGAFPLTLTQTGTTTVTLPTSGTLVETGVTTLSSLASVGTITTGTWSATAIGATKGGTGATSVTQGDLLYGASNAWSKLAKDTNSTRYLSNTGASNDPAWAQVALATGVSGTLPILNGGTGQTAFTAGSIVFASSTTVLGESNTKLFWDNTNSRLGIGGNTPSSTVQITSTNSPLTNAATWTNYPLLVQNTVTTNSSSTGMCFVITGTADNCTASIITKRTGSAGQGELQFYTKNSTSNGVAPLQRMTIDNAGNVGIGTSTPTALLDIGALGSTLGVMRLEGSTSGYVQLQAAAAAGSWTMTLPATAGTSGQFLSTDGAGATSWASGGGLKTTLTKTADESITSDSTLSDDAALKFTMAANKNYAIRGYLAYTSANATPDFKFIFNGPASPTAVQGYSQFVPLNNDTTAPSSDAFNSYANSANSVTGADVGLGWVKFDLFVQNGANAGTFAIQWAQNTSNGATTTVSKGSYMEYTEQ